MTLSSLLASLSVAFTADDLALIAAQAEARGLSPAAFVVGAVRRELETRRAETTEIRPTHAVAAQDEEKA